LDIDVSFWFADKSGVLPSIAIAEVKQDAFSLQSEFVGEMHHLGIRAMRFSKYCIGLTMLNHQLKANNFKPLWLHINKLLQN
jgi:hypothetical protein